MDTAQEIKLDQRNCSSVRPSKTICLFPEACANQLALFEEVVATWTRVPSTGSRQSGATTLQALIHRPLLA